MVTPTIVQVGIASTAPIATLVIVTTIIDAIDPGTTILGEIGGRGMRRPYKTTPRDIAELVFMKRLFTINWQNIRL